MIKSLYDCFKHWSDNGSVYLIGDTHFADPDCKIINNKWPEPEEQVKIINSIVSANDTLVILGDIGDINYVKKLRGYKVLITGNHDKGISNYKREENFDVINCDPYLKEFENDKEKKFEEIREKSVEYFSLNWKKYTDSIYAKAKRKVEQELKDKDNFDSLTLSNTKTMANPASYWIAHYDNKLFDEIYSGPVFISPKIILSHEPVNISVALNIHGHIHGGKYEESNNSLNLAADVINYKPVSLSKIIKNGYLSKINDIHENVIKRR